MARLKEAYDVESKHGPLYTGGHIQWLADHLYCQTDTAVRVLNVNDGSTTRQIGGLPSDADPFNIEFDADPIQTFVTDGLILVTSHFSGLLKLWKCEDGELMKVWKHTHKAPVSKLYLDDGILISGGADGAVRVWDLQHQSCIMALKQCQGVVNVVQVDPGKSTILASGDDGFIHSWCFKTGTPKLSYKEHFSKITSLVWVNDSNQKNSDGIDDETKGEETKSQCFVSAGRDKVIVLWKLGQRAPLKVMAAYESLEVIVAMPGKFKLPDFKSQPGCVYVASGGEHGLVRIWDVTNSKEVYKQQQQTQKSSSDSAADGSKNNSAQMITHLLLNSKRLAVVRADHNITLFYLKSFACLKQFVGFSDQILDVAFVGKNESHLAVATNSPDIKLYENSTMNCQLLQGHTDIVVALSTSKSNPDLLVSAGKDKTVRLWLLQENAMSCVAVGMRHAAAVSSVAFANTSQSFLVSVDGAIEDKIGSRNHKRDDEAISGNLDTGAGCSQLRFWHVPAKFKQKAAILDCYQAAKAHAASINCVTVAPNDRMIATASRDKTVKLWDEKANLIATLKGHKRGVLCVRFAQVDQVLMTSSVDCTIKLWSMTSLECLKSLQGHDSSITNCEFIANGMQVISTGADGTVRLHDVKSSEIVQTMTQHQQEVNALAVSADESQLVTGGGDSLLIRWKDVTEERKTQRRQEQEQTILDTQDLSNYVQNKQYLKALKLAVKLDRPKQVFSLVEKLIAENDVSGLRTTVQKLNDLQKDKLLHYCTGWFGHTDTAPVASRVQSILVRDYQLGRFKPVEPIDEVLKKQLPYAERHYDRLTKLMQDLQIIDYAINMMESRVN